MRYLATYFDTNGVGRMAGPEADFSTEIEARAYLAAIEARLTKEHKVDYRIVACRVGHKIADMRAAGMAT